MRKTTTDPREPVFADATAPAWLHDLMAELGESGVATIRETLRARGINPDGKVGLGLAGGIAHLSWRLAARLAVGDDEDEWNQTAQLGATVAIATPPEAEVRRRVEARELAFIDGHTLGRQAGDPRAAAIAARAAMANAVRDTAETMAHRLGLDKVAACEVAIDAVGAVAASILAGGSPDAAALERNLAEATRGIAENARATFLQIDTSEIGSSQ